MTINVIPVTDFSDLDVQNGQTQRSYVRNVDILFDSDSAALDSLFAAAASRIQVSKFGLNGMNGVLQTAPSISKVGSKLKLDFGANGVGGVTANRNTIAGDGYYEIGIDFDGNGSFETTAHFFRLLGDVTGDGSVTAADKAAVQAGIGVPYDVERDVNGDGVVSGLDPTAMLRSIGRKLGDGLTWDD